MKRLMLISGWLFCQTILLWSAPNELPQAQAWLESAWVCWEGTAEDYRVYCQKEGEDLVQVDQALLRDYGDHWRADALGLSQGRYRLKVVPLKKGRERLHQSWTSEWLDVKPHDRSGFAHFKRNEGVGAYNNDGTLKADAQVIYITSENASTVTAVIDGMERKGFQNLLDAKQKGLSSRPICFRIIGCIDTSQMDDFSSQSQGLQLKGKRAESEMNITIEGVGNDAVFKGFGLLIRNCSSVEVRNLGIMLCLDDALSLDTRNSHCWIHHLDFFYGQAGQDEDQAKGDGSLDCKGQSNYLTFSYNHFWDNGKASLCGMRYDTTETFVSYHHNWFDHSDSRHPRVRGASVHVYNNYFNACAHYGIGATMGANIFAEANYFRQVRKPMLISQQGSDINHPTKKGSFSNEPGGMIKAYGNYFAELPKHVRWATQDSSAIDFDAYQVAHRNDSVPSCFVCRVGGTAYNNFDTRPQLMYPYQADPAEEVSNIVCGPLGAGRMQHGDFSWQFSPDSVTSDELDTALLEALRSYQSKLVRVKQ